MQVRGATVATVQQQIRAWQGTPRWDALVAHLPADQMRLLTDTIDLRGWYSLRSYGELLEAIASVCEPDQALPTLAELGCAVVDDGLNRFHKVLFRFATPATVIRGSALLWRSFFKGTKLRIVANRQRRISLEIVGGDFCTPALCHSIGAGLARTLERAGARDVVRESHQCRSAGAAGHCQFSYRWN